jgi:hypothetical protein
MSVRTRTRTARPIAERLATSRRAAFIGRQAELAVLRSALSARRPPFSVLHVHGPGGVGKSTLLLEFARLAREAGRTVVMLDGRDVQPSRPAFLAALVEALGAATRRKGRRPTVPDRAVILIDTYESLSALDRWLRDAVLPTWPSGVLTVLAGREPPALPWVTDLAWAPMTRVLPLGNFAPDESRAFLRARSVATARHPRVLEFTHGHPLALALVADLFAGRHGADFDPAQAPDVVRHLFALFLETVPEHRLREALTACAVARVTTERLLVDLYGEANGRDAFEWLRGRSFVQTGPGGLFPHDLVRELVLAEARWRDGAALGTLSRRIYTALHAQIAASHGRDAQRLKMDALYVTRIRPTNSRFFDWSALDDARVEPAEASDADWIVELVRRHEGPAAADLARRWWCAQPAAFQVFRGADDARFGFLALLDVGRAGTAAPADPAVAAARTFVERHGPVRPGEGVVYLRWWMHAERYQEVTAAINLTAMHVVSHCVTQPGIAWNFVAMADPSFWTAHFEGVNFPRVPDADFAVGGRRYGVFAHDWRIEPPADWMMGARPPMPFAMRSGTSATRRDPVAFQRAVRQALRDYTRPDALAIGPCRSWLLVRDAGEPGARGAALQRLLREAVESLLANPRDRRLHRALWHTYFEPLATQEQVAERLDLPFSTYRHHLAGGIERIARWLWLREQSLTPS